MVADPPGAIYKLHFYIISTITEQFMLKEYNQTREVFDCALFHITCSICCCCNAANC